MYDIGTSLRKRYDKYLGSIYNQSNIQAKSSAYARTRMSCELVMAAMFQPTTTEKWNPELNWQPTLCDYVSAEDDYVSFIILFYRLCFRLDYVLQMFLSEKNCKVLPLKRIEIERDRIMGKFNQYRDIFEIFSNNSGMKMETPADVTPLYDILRCQVI